MYCANIRIALMPYNAHELIVRQMNYHYLAFLFRSHIYSAYLNTKSTRIKNKIKRKKIA